MKNKFFKSRLPIAGALWWVFTLSAAAQVKQSKTLQHNFPLSGSSSLSIINKYGQIHVNTAPVAQIQIKILITADAKNTETAQKILSGLEVKVQSGPQISLETVASLGWKNLMNEVQIQSLQGNQTVPVKTSSKADYQVDYTITMPENFPLSLNNRFGGIYVGKHTGRLQLWLEYGSLKTGRLEGNDKKIVNVKFGNADIDYAEEAEITMAYSTLRLNQAQRIYFEGKYGNAEIGQVHHITGSSAYSQFQLSTLTGNLTMSTRHDGRFQVGPVANRFGQVEITGEYSQISLTMAPEASYNFEFDLKYARLEGSQNGFQFQHKQEANTSAFYQGRKGSGGSSRLKVVSRYGDVSLL
ncbi:MAG: hypothetical protein HC913_03880 [Microscillaceae bacterium]|nr:hypothetical protein [Microscillaceae bacterium]